MVLPCRAHHSHLYRDLRRIICSSLPQPSIRIDLHQAPYAPKPSTSSSSYSTLAPNFPSVYRLPSTPPLPPLKHTSSIRVLKATPRLFLAVFGASTTIAALNQEKIFHSIEQQQKQKKKYTLLNAFDSNALKYEEPSALIGLSRSLRFWINVLPSYVHYRLLHWYYTSPWSKNLAEDDEAIERAYNRLHDKYAPKTEKLTLSLRGFYTKLAQICSTRDELVPPQYMEWCKKLQDDLSPEWDELEVYQFVKKQWKEILGVDVDDVLEHGWWKKENMIGAASIGQVQRAVRKDTKEQVVVKVQYPGVEHLFRGDIQTIKQFCQLAMPQNVPFIQEIEKQFLTEFDYVGEAQNLQLVRANLQKKPWNALVDVPKPYIELCTKHILVMSFLPGKKLVDGVRAQFGRIAEQRGMTLQQLEEQEKERAFDDTEKSKKKMYWITLALKIRDRLANMVIASWNWTMGAVIPASKREYYDTPLPINLAQVIDTLVRVHGYEIFIDGAFNGDPHPGNVLLMPDGKLGLIDYGQVKKLDVQERIAYAKLILALTHDVKSEVVRIAVEELDTKTERNLPWVIYKLQAFYHDRDTDDILEGHNVQLFMEWMQKEDPLVHISDHYVMAGRVSVLLRGVANAFHLRMKTAKYWAPYAAQLLKEHGIDYDPRKMQTDPKYAVSS